MKALLLPMLLAAVGGFAQAQSVMLTGTIGSRAILIVDGSAPKTVAVGETFQGVRLLSLAAEQATDVLQDAPQLHHVRAVAHPQRS